MTDEFFAYIVGVTVSLLFEYIPGLRDLYDKLTKVQKRAAMAGLFVVAAGVLFGLSCAGVVSYFECSQAGAITAGLMVIRALIANQTTHKLAKRAEK